MSSSRGTWPKTGWQVPGYCSSGLTEKRPSGLFVGLSTLDLVHFVDRSPGRNEKIFANDTFIGAGGPATNAAVTFSFLGGTAHLVSSVGTHVTGSLILRELAEYGVRHTDSRTSRHTPPLISSVVVSTDNGDRSIVTSPIEITSADSGLVSDLLQRLAPDFMLVDGHEPELALNAARLARQHRIPVVFDGGRWKPHFPKLLESVDHALVSEGFRCPDGDSPEQVFSYLHRKGASHTAVTRGHQPILHSSGAEISALKVTQVEAVDTLAAGDIFHGAYCFGFWGLGLSFTQALEFAAKVAGRSCREYGPRRWMKKWPPEA